MNKKVVLAFSGGLDTSFCIPYLIDQGYEVHTLFVNTGGISTKEELAITKRANELGAKKHININVEKKYIPHFATWINERRWEIEEDNDMPDLVDRLKKLGYEYLGNEGNFEKFTKDGKNYKIDIYDEKHQMQLVQ